MALQQVAVVASSGGVRIISTGYRPRTVTHSLGLREAGTYVLLLDVSLDHDDFGQVFYGRPSQDFSGEDSTEFPLFKGRNVVGIPLSSPATLERIRLDPGHRPGTYTLKRLEIKKLADDAVLTRTGE